MRDHFPPNFRLLATVAVVVVAMTVAHAMIPGSGPVLGRVCCASVGVLWMFGFLVWSARGLYLTDTHLVQYWMRPGYVAKRIRLARIVDLNRTRRATYITTASGQILGISVIRYYDDLLPTLQARVGPNVLVKDTRTAT